MIELLGKTYYRYILFAMDELGTWRLWLLLFFGRHCTSIYMISKGLIRRDVGTHLICYTRNIYQSTLAQLQQVVWQHGCSWKSWMPSFRCKLLLGRAKIMMTENYMKTYSHKVTLIEERDAWSSSANHHLKWEIFAYLLNSAEGLFYGDFIICSFWL